MLAARVAEGFDARQIQVNFLSDSLWSLSMPLIVLLCTCSEMGGVGPLANILNDQFKAVMENKTMDSDQQQPSNRDLQLVYEALFCCWLLSYNPVVAENDFTGTTIILNCVRLLREVDKEKVTISFLD